VIVGAILLLVGYRIYRGESLESKLTGGVLLIVSVIFIYFIAYASIQEYWNSLSGALVTIPYTPKVTLPPLPGPLVSEASIEAVTLLLLVICAVFYAFPYLRSGKGLSILKIVLSILVIIFACGLLRFNFSMVMMMSNLLPLLSQTLASVWMIFFGFLVLGISGIIMIISACLPIGLSIKELLVSKEIPAIPPTSTIQTKEETNIKYCHKCGTSMPLSATYCPKCGIKQPSKDK
jgi:ribosomal protein L40E